MTASPAAAVLARLRDHLLVVVVEREAQDFNLVVTPGDRAHAVPGLLEELAECSAEVMALLGVELAPWPARCRAAARWWPGPGGHLRPLVGQVVSTELGPARLVEVAPHGSRVELLARPGRTQLIGHWEVGPPAAPRAAVAAGAAQGGGAG